VFQELRRFENPHKSFTYHLHGYESVVGPVKGVYTKESALNKAREHALLVSSRPSFVTILTLGKSTS
jgi:nuclear factor related to kappa-B-binding protein